MQRHAEEIDVYLQAHAPSTEAPTIGGKRVRGLEGGVQQARAGAGGVMVACLGPPLKKADALVGLGSMLEVRCTVCARLIVLPVPEIL